MVARYRNLWQELVAEGIADAFNLADYELPSQPGLPYWEAKGVEPAEGQDLFAWMAQEYKPVCKGKTKLYLFVDWLSGSNAKIDASLARFAENCVKHGFDGLDIHEAANLEGRMGLLQRCADRLRGVDPGPLQ
jgi:hypothetical protein